MSLVRALKWSYFAEWVSKAFTPVIFVVLARLLTPEDFGVMTSAAMVIAFSQIFWEAGMAKALIQRQTDVDDAANAAFWTNIVLGVLIATLLFLGARQIAHTFFHDDKVTAVLRVMTLQILLGAASSVQTALLQKEMSFKKLFWVRFTTVGLPGLASIPLAWNGMGYWALVAGTLVGQTAQVSMLWRMSPWRPTWSFRLHVAKDMGRFGAWAGASGALAWFYSWADSLVVGMYLGSHDLGLFRVGNQFAILVFGALFGPIAPVLYSYLSKMKSGKNQMRTASETVIGALTFTAIPIGVIIFFLSDGIGDLFFGQKWQGIGLVIGILALREGFAWLVAMNGEFYRASGKPDLETAAMLSTAIIYLIIYVVSIQFGFWSFLIAKLSTVFVGIAAQLYFLNACLSTGVLQILGNTLKLAVISMLACIATVPLFSKAYVGAGLLQLISVGVVSAATYVALILIISRKDLFALLRRIPINKCRGL